MQYTSISADQFAQLDGLDDWRVVVNAIHATFRAGTFPAATAFASAIATIAEDAAHHPDIDIRYPDRVHVVLTTHFTGGLTTIDVDVARQISAVAKAGEMASAPTGVQGVEIAIDTTHPDQIRPFWAAVLGYTEVDGALVDPLRIGPPLWFQQMDMDRVGRGRFHLDVSVAEDAAQERIAAALAAGGTMVSDKYAKSWWILADADGNEACVCTWQDR